MNENELLEKSLELNRIQAELLKDKSKSQRAPYICVICMTVVIIALLFFFSQYEFYTEETTITQDTAEGGGNNVYMEGEQAQYHEAEDDVNSETDG